jgi:FHS family glucose/mannose:H+ symporter-like MFS transporter
MPPSPARRRAIAAVIGCSAFFLIGWSALLVPSLIRSIEASFGQTDAAVGTYFLFQSLFSATGSVSGGLLTERVGRRVVLTLAASLVGLGLLTIGTVGSWELILLAAVPFGLGFGAIDGGVNGLVLDLYPESRGRALNLAHICFSLGALGSPLVVGRALEGGIPWQAPIIATALAAIVIAVLLAIGPLPSGRHAHPIGEGAGASAASWRVGLAWALVGLGIAIGCYVAAEIGVSNWLVRFLDSATIGLATAALALYWGALSLGRLASAAWSDRFDHARLAAVSATVSGIALVAAVAVPSIPMSILLFGVVGFAFGPIYPLIMAVAGDRYPKRSAAVSGLLAGCAVVGSVFYPPLMGFMSVTIGLAPAMTGAGILALAAGLALWLVARAGSSERAEALEAATSA